MQLIRIFGGSTYFFKIIVFTHDLPCTVKVSRINTHVENTTGAMFLEFCVQLKI